MNKQIIKDEETKNLNKHYHRHYHQQNCWGFHSEAIVGTIVEGWDLHQFCLIIPKAIVGTIVEG